MERSGEAFCITTIPEVHKRVTDVGDSTVLAAIAVQRQVRVVVCPLEATDIHCVMEILNTEHARKVTDHHCLLISRALEGHLGESYLGNVSATHIDLICEDRSRLIQMFSWK